MRPSNSGVVAVSILLVTSSAAAYDVSDNLSINGVLAAAGQCQNVSDSAGDDDICRAAIPFQTEVDFRPDEANQFFFKLAYASGNGLNRVTPFNVAPWAADLEDDVVGINGSNRDYLLAAWYKYISTYGDDGSVSITFGILDSTDYIDGNTYANDEYTQFMNEVFVNSGSYGLPSYDSGAALEWSSGDWSINALGMNVNENDDGYNYNFLSGQLGFHPKTTMGDGNYRLIVVAANSRFLDPSGTQLHDRLAYGFSFDQAFGDIIGGFIRVGWQTDDAAVEYSAGYSGGLNFAGNGWGREDDNIGVGYALLQGGNTGIDKSHVAEAYYRIQVNDALGVTADIQYISDKYEPATSTFNPKGWIAGLRATAEF